MSRRKVRAYKLRWSARLDCGHWAAAGTRIIHDSSGRRCVDCVLATHTRKDSTAA